MLPPPHVETPKMWKTDEILAVSCMFVCLFSEGSAYICSTFLLNLRSFFIWSAEKNKFCESKQPKTSDLVVINHLNVGTESTQNGASS